MNDSMSQNDLVLPHSAAAGFDGESMAQISEPGQRSFSPDHPKTVENDLILGKFSPKSDLSAPKWPRFARREARVGAAADVSTGNLSVVNAGLAKLVRAKSMVAPFDHQF